MKRLAAVPAGLAAMVIAITIARLATQQPDASPDPAWPTVDGDLPLQAIYEGRLPCAEPGCDKIKVSLVLYGIGAPARYWLGTVAVDGGDDRQVRQGKVVIPAASPGATGRDILVLDRAGPAPLTGRFWQVSPDILLILGADDRPLPGTESWGMMLSQTGP